MHVRDSSSTKPDSHSLNPSKLIDQEWLCCVLGWKVICHRCNQFVFVRFIRGLVFKSFYSKDLFTLHNIPAPSPLRPWICNLKCMSEILLPPLNLTHSLDPAAAQLKGPWPPMKMLWILILVTSKSIDQEWLCCIWGWKVMSLVQRAADTTQLKRDSWNDKRFDAQSTQQL